MEKCATVTRYRAYKEYQGEEKTTCRLQRIEPKNWFCEKPDLWPVPPKWPLRPIWDFIILLWWPSTKMECHFSFYDYFYILYIRTWNAEQKLWTECKTPNWDHRKQRASRRKEKTSWVSVAEPEWHTGRGWGTMGGRECGQRGLGAWAGPGPGPTCHQRSADASLHPPPWSQSSTLLKRTYSVGIVHIRKYCSINGVDCLQTTIISMGPNPGG